MLSVGFFFTNLTRHCPLSVQKYYLLLFVVYINTVLHLINYLIVEDVFIGEKGGRKKGDRRLCRGPWH
jgi:hypothetical protein